MDRSPDPSFFILLINGPDQGGGKKFCDAYAVRLSDLLTLPDLHNRAARFPHREAAVSRLCGNAFLVLYFLRATSL